MPSCSCGLPMSLSRTGRGSVCTHCDRPLVGHVEAACPRCREALGKARGQ